MDNQNNIQEQINTQLSFFSKLGIFFSVHKSMILIVAVLSSVSFGTTGYLLTSNLQPKQTNNFSPKGSVSEVSAPVVTPKIAQTATPSATPTPKLILEKDETDSWRDFVSSKYAYSIKYPQSWSAAITTQEDPKILEYVVFNPKDATKSGTLSISLSYGTRTYAQALAIDSQIGESIFVASTSGTKKTSKTSEGVESTSIIIPYGKNSIIFYARDEYLTTFNQMLPTLKLSK